MKRSIMVLLLSILIIAMAGASLAIDVETRNFAESYWGQPYISFVIDADKSSRKKLAANVYQYNGKTVERSNNASPTSQYNVKVIVNCSTGLYKIIVLKPTDVVDKYGNIKKSGYKEIDLGWERYPISDEGRTLCEPSQK